MRIVLLLLVDILPLYTLDSFVMKMICEELKKPLRLLRQAGDRYGTDHCTVHVFPPRTALSIYTVSTQYLHGIYTISTQYLQYLH